MKRLKVIGIGNRIMGDDGIGVYVVEELIQQQFLNDIEYVVGETDIEYCLDCINSDNESFIIIIDAAILGKKPGTVTKFTINDMALCTSMMSSAHNYNLIEAGFKQLLDYNFTIIGIEPGIVDFKWGLSDALSEAFIQIIADVKKCIIKLISYINPVEN